MGKGQPVNSSDFTGSVDLPAQELMSFLRALQHSFLCKVGMICQPFSDHLTGAQGVLCYDAPTGRPGETEEEEEYQFAVCLLLPSIFTCLQKHAHTTSAALSSLPALPSSFMQMPVCSWETLVVPQIHSTSRGSLIFFVPRINKSLIPSVQTILSSSVVYHHLPPLSLPCVLAR